MAQHGEGGGGLVVGGDGNVDDGSRGRWERPRAHRRPCLTIHGHTKGTAWLDFARRKQKLESVYHSVFIRWYILNKLSYRILHKDVYSGWDTTTATYVRTPTPTSPSRPKPPLPLSLISTCVYGGIYLRCSRRSYLPTPYLPQAHPLSQLLPMNEMTPLSADPVGIHGPADHHRHQAREGKPPVLLDTWECDSGNGAEELEDVDDRVLGAGEARALVRGHQRLRELLGRQVEDPHAEPRERQEREQDNAPGQVG